MSSYEDYSRTAGRYDATRVAIGIEILLGCFRRAGKPLAQMTILDAGCGTGSYSLALVECVARIEAVDLNPDMLKVAQGKLGAAVALGKVALHRAPIDRLPFKDGSIDGIMVNQVLHHIPDDASQGYPGLRRAIAEFARVLRPGGVLVINTCSHEQLRNGWWYYDLIPAACTRVCERHVPIDDLCALLTEQGFALGGRFVPVDAVIQGAAYRNSRGPLDAEWRDGDSIWALVSAKELEAAQQRVRALDREGALESYMSRRDARRRHVGQVTFVAARRGQ